MHSAENQPSTMPFSGFPLNDGGNDNESPLKLSRVPYVVNLSIALTHRGWEAHNRLLSRAEVAEWQTR